MNILIRAWRAEDIPAIAHIMTPHTLWQRYGVTPASALARVTSLHQQGKLGLVADDHDTLVGFALFHTKTFGGDGYIRLFSVDKNYTSTGIGPYLLAAVETHLLSIGVKRLVLLSAHGNEGARRFYERHNFVLAGRLTNWVIEGKDEILYTKRLTPSSPAERCAKRTLDARLPEKF